MMHALLISREESVFTELKKALSENNITTKWTDTADNALFRLSDEKFDLFITQEQLPDMTARELIEKVLFKNAMMNCVVLSALSHKEFHDAYEGLGVLMQFPPAPGKKNAQDLLDHLGLIARITRQTNKPEGE